MTDDPVEYDEPKLARLLVAFTTIVRSETYG